MRYKKKQRKTYGVYFHAEKNVIYTGIKKTKK